MLCFAGGHTIQPMFAIIIGSSSNSRSSDVRCSCLHPPRGASSHAGCIHISDISPNTQQRGFQEERSPSYPKDRFYSGHGYPQLPKVPMPSVPRPPLPHDRCWNWHHLKLRGSDGLGTVTQKLHHSAVELEVTGFHLDGGTMQKGYCCHGSVSLPQPLTAPIPSIAHEPPRSYGNWYKTKWYHRSLCGNNRFAIVAQSLCNSAVIQEATGSRLVTAQC